MSDLRQNVFCLPEGDAVFVYPAAISKESHQDLTDWLALMQRRVDAAYTESPDDS